VNVSQLKLRSEKFDDDDDDDNDNNNKNNNIVYYDFLDTQMTLLLVHQVRVWI